MTIIETFELPRDDWYDSAGRIYKDVLIENLNACEQKLMELQSLDAFNIQPPDFNTMVYPDVTLASSDDSIINMRSLFSIINVMNYPIELVISGIKIRKVSYWNSNYNYITINDFTVSNVSTTDKYVYVDLTDDTIKCTNSPSTAAANILLGVYDSTSKSIIGVYSPQATNLNLMYLLANIQTDSGHLSKNWQDGGYVYRNPNNSSRAVGFFDGESKTGTRSINYSDYGRA